MLRNLQSTSVLGGSNKVFVSPNFPFSAPSGGGADGGFQMTGDGFTFGAGGIQINAQGIDPSCFTFSTSMDDSSDEDTGPPSVSVFVLVHMCFKFHFLMPEGCANT